MKIQNHDFTKECVELEFIALVPAENTEYPNTVDKFTIYYLDRATKIVLPIPVDSNFARNFFAVEYETGEIEPTLYNTSTRIINALQANLVSITIYNSDGNKFYSYLDLKKRNRYV